MLADIWLGNGTIFNIIIIVVYDMFSQLHCYYYYYRCIMIRQDTSRHMVTTIHNVTTDMEHVSCYADNGYGIPMQASKKVQISCE